MQSYNFGPASPEVDMVFGACRPGHRLAHPGTNVNEWLEFMGEHGISRVCCLLDSRHLEKYERPLLDRYQNYFGRENVFHAPIEDFTVVESRTLHESIVPFINDAVAEAEPVVVHCSAGLGRTGHVLALWLVLECGYTLDAALLIQRELGRRPMEAADRDELCQLLSEGNHQS